MTRAANFADEIMRRLKLGLVDGDDVPAPWDDIVLHYSIGLDEGEIDRMKERGSKPLANGGAMMSKGERAAFFAEKKKEQEERQRAEQQRARKDLSGRS